jgi:hypothetical protein
MPEPLSTASAAADALGKFWDRSIPFLIAVAAASGLVGLLTLGFWYFGQPTYWQQFGFYLAGAFVISASFALVRTVANARTKSLHITVIEAASSWHPTRNQLTGVSGAQFDIRFRAANQTAGQVYIGRVTLKEPNRKHVDVHASIIDLLTENYSSQHPVPPRATRSGHISFFTDAPEGLPERVQVRLLVEDQHGTKNWLEGNIRQQ